MGVVSSLSLTSLSCFFLGYLMACLLISIFSHYFTLKWEVSLVEILTLGFSIWAAIVAPPSSQASHLRC